MIYKKIILLCFLHLVLCVDVVCSQNIIYQCDFEDYDEHDKWAMNVGGEGQSCANKWSIGAAGQNGGRFGLFVSSDGESNNYVNAKKPLTVVSYRTLTLDAGEYEFSFDWQAGGWQDSISNEDGLYVCWVPDSIRTNSQSEAETMAKYVMQYALDFGGKGKKLSQSAWNTVIDTIKTDGTPHKIVFVWRNGVRGVRPPAACVDNILVMPVGYCYKPKDLKLDVNDLDVTFSWSGEAESYDVRCYNGRTKRWKNYDNVKDTFVVVEGVEEGICTYYVRSRCEGINGTWVSISQFVYYPGARCIDYMSLNSENCFTSMNPSNTDGSGTSMFTPGKLDKGYMSIESRHTIHYDVEERDPNTAGQLRTVPEGEAASVRLGNWDTGGEAERVEYRYKVDASGSAVLILKYAVVLQDPDHSEYLQPKFELEVLKVVNGRLVAIDKDGCGEAKFTAGANTSGVGWHEFKGGWWKDWTTVSINLREHDGEEVVVRLTTYDCAELGHFGYAYFTLDCSDGELESSACGDVEADTLLGPEGFNYRWYKKSERNKTLSEERQYIISTKDTAVYCLDVIQPTNTQCYYTLETSGMKRFPKADGESRAYVEECMNKVEFTNKSYVALSNGKKGDDCDVIWDFGDGSTSANANPVHVYPATGGKFTAVLTASIGGGKCQEIKTFELNLPNVTDMRDTIVAIVCPGESYEFGGDYYFATGVYADTVPTEYGCNNITVLDLTVMEAIEEYDTICSTDVYYVDGVQVTQSGRYAIKSTLGCDSVVKNVLVNESLVLGIDSIVSVCTTDANLVIPFEEESGRLLKYSIAFEDEAMLSVSDLEPEDGAMVIPMDVGVKPNRYKATLSFGELACGGDDIEVLVDVYYPDSVIAQRWNDVLAVRNDVYNGGYDFVAYQWYKNNEVIDGATSSILYEELDPSAEYSVMLTRADGVSEMVCGMKPQKFDDLDDDAVLVFTPLNSSDVSIRVSVSASVRVWSSVGLLVGEYLINKGENVVNLGDDNLGIYIFEFIFEDGQRKIECVIL